MILWGKWANEMGKEKEGNGSQSAESHLSTRATVVFDQRRPFITVESVNVRETLLESPIFVRRGGRIV